MTGRRSSATGSGFGSSSTASTWSTGRASAAPGVARRRAVRAAVAGHGLELHSTFTGLAAYSANLLLVARRGRSRGGARRGTGRSSGSPPTVGGRATGGHVGCFSVPDWRDPAAAKRRLWDGLRGALAGSRAMRRGAGLEYLVVENLAVAREPSTMAMIRRAARRRRRRAGADPPLPGRRPHVRARHGRDRIATRTPGSGARSLRRRSSSSSSRTLTAITTGRSRGPIQRGSAHLGRTRSSTRSATAASRRAR